MRLLVVIATLIVAGLGIWYGYWLLIPPTALLAGIVLYRFDAQKIPNDLVVRLFAFLESQDWASVALLALICAAIAGWAGQEFLKSYWPGFVWLGAMALVLTSATMFDRKYVAAKSRFAVALPEVVRGWQRWEWVIVGLVTLVALALRLYHLDRLLPFIHGDEGEMGMRALQILHGDIPEFRGDPIPLFGSSFLNHPTLYHYLQALALWIGGESMLSLRALSALFGAMCVPLIYVIGRLGWGWIAGIAAAWWLAVSHIHIQFSRISLNNIESVWFGILFILLLFFIYYLVQSADTDNTQAQVAQGFAQPVALLPYALLGITVSLAQYLYYGSRLLPVIVVPLFFVLWLRRRITIYQFAIFVLAALVTYLPLLFHFISNPDSFTNRSFGVFVFSPGNLSHSLGENYVWWRDIPGLLLEQTKRTVRFLIDRGDISSFYSPEGAGLDLVTSVCFWFGLGISIYALRRLEEFTLLVWLCAGLLLAGILTSDPPNAPRLIVVMPVTYLFAGIFLQHLHDYFAKGKVNIKRSGLVIFVLILAASAYLNISQYFVRFAKEMGYLVPSTIGMEVARIKEDSQVILLGGPHLFVEYGVFRFVDRGAEMYNLDNIADLDTFLAEHPTNKQRTFFVLTHRNEDLDVLRGKFPQGVEEERRDPADRLLYTTFSAQQ